MVEDIFQKKIRSLQEIRDISTNNYFKNNVISLIDLVQQNQSKYYEFCDIIENFEKNNSQNTLSNQMDIQKMLNSTDLLDESTKELFILINERHINSQRDKANIEYLERQLLSQSKDLARILIINILSDDYTDKTIETIVKCYEELLSKITLSGINLAHIKTIIDIQNLDKKNIQTSNALLNSIDIQIAIFRNVLDLFHNYNMIYAS